MANTYFFKINALDCKVNLDGLENAVFNVHWSYFGETELVSGSKVSVSSIGVQSIDAPSGDNFIAYEDLTEEIVVGWLESKLDVEKLKENIDAQLAEKLAPKIVTLPLPSLAPSPITTPAPSGSAE